MHGQNRIKFVHSVVCGQHLMDAFQGLTDVRQEGDRGLIAPEPSVLFRWMERRWRICLSSYPFSLKVVSGTQTLHELHVPEDEGTALLH